MPLSATWTSKEVHGTWRNPFSGTLEGGTWDATLGNRIVNTLSSGKKQIFRAGKIASGSLNTTEGLPSLSLQLPVVDDPDNLPQGGSITLKITFASGSGGETFVLSPLQTWPDGDESTGGGFDLASILDPTIVPAAPPVAIIGKPGGVAALNAQGLVVNADGSVPAGTGGGGGGTTLTAYSQIAALTGYPATFPPTIGTTSTTAKQGDWLPSSQDINDASSIGRALITTASAAAARSTIGAGTSSLALGTTSTTAKAGDYQPTWTQVTGKPAVIAAGADAATARAAIGFDIAARQAVPWGRMAWNSITKKWAAWDPTAASGAGAYVDDAPRPNCPPGACTYDATNDATATQPIGAQAPQQVAGFAGDAGEFNSSSAFYT